MTSLAVRAKALTLAFSLDFSQTRAVSDGGRSLIGTAFTPGLG